MPEQNNYNLNKERQIAGEITVTPSSDEAIEADVERLRREISGLSSSDVVIEGESYKPITGLASDQSEQFSQRVDIKTIDISSRLTSNRSALGLELLRQRKTKRAA